MANGNPPVASEKLEIAASFLRPIELRVLRLSARERLSTIEIAERLGCSPLDAEQLLAEALYRLDRILEWQARPWWRFW